MKKMKLGSAAVGTDEDAWVIVNDVIVKFLGRYEDFAFTDALKLARSLNNNPKLKAEYYNEAVKKLEEKNEKDNYSRSSKDIC